MMSDTPKTETAATSTRAITTGGGLDGAAGRARKKLSRPWASVGSILIAVLWTIPTLGLFISSFRPRDQIQSSGWWTFFADPQVTLGYIREMGRILRPGGWAAFQVSNDPSVHKPRGERGAKQKLKVALGRAPGGQEHGAWLGSAVTVNEVRAAAGEGGMGIERTEGEGTQFCLVLTRKRG